MMENNSQTTRTLENAYNITEEEIENLLLDLGASPQYNGYWLTKYSLILISREPERLQLVTKWLYPDVGKEYQIRDMAVERNIRTIIQKIWEANRPALRTLEGFRRGKRPSSSQFLSMLWTHLVRQKLSKKKQPGTKRAPKEEANTRVTC